MLEPCPIIVYGIQRTDVKNCFYEKVSCDPMECAWGGQKSSACRRYAEDFRGSKWCRLIKKSNRSEVQGSKVND